MSLATRAAALGTFIAGSCLLAGCSSAPATPAGAVTSPLSTSLSASGGGAWAVVPMGGSAADEDNFWELFTRPAASAKWTLVTPPGVADNGGLVAAAPATGDQLGVAFRPSQDLTFSPLALTSNSGKTWGTGLLDAAVAAVPDAFAADGGRLLALLSDGAVEQATAPAATSTAWRRLAAPGAIAASAAGSDCTITGLTAVAYTTAGTPLAAASCAHPGVAGIFADTGGIWQAVGPAVPASLAARQVQVLRLTGTSAGNTALLRAGSGSTASLLAAWTSDGVHWSVSAPLAVGADAILASGTGPAAAAWVLLTGGRAETVSGTAAGAAWTALPAPPRGTVALAAGSGSSFDALAVSGGTLTVYQLTAAGAWSQTQVISVPIQYGSSS